MSFIRKCRRESFGGVVYSEQPGYTAFVDNAAADSLGIPNRTKMPPKGLFTAPLDVHMSITDRCNLRCQGCYAHTQQDDAAADMSLEMAYRILDRLASLQVFTVALGGGEPLLHPNLLDIARYARSRLIVPNVTTSGMSIDGAMARECHVFGSIHLSCHDASELPRLGETHAVLQADGIAPGLNVLVSSITYRSLPDIWAWCRKNRVSRILIQKFKLTAHNRACEAMRLTPEQEQSLLPLVRKLSRSHGILPILDCSLFPALAYHEPRRHDLEFFDVNGCQGGNAFLAVTTDGKFKPCSFCDETLGNIETLDRESWIGGEKLKRFRCWSSDDFCRSCRYFDLCNGGCRVDRQSWCAKQQAARR